MLTIVGMKALEASLLENCIEHCFAATGPAQVEFDGPASPVNLLDGDLFSLIVPKPVDLEWCQGRMVHLRRIGMLHTLCGADPKACPDQFLAPGGCGHRATLEPHEVVDRHQCKGCLRIARQKGLEPPK